MTGTATDEPAAGGLEAAGAAGRVAGGAWIWPSEIWEMGWTLALYCAAATAAKTANE
jgi:hypothetical protein